MVPGDQSGYPDQSGNCGNAQVDVPHDDCHPPQVNSQQHRCGLTSQIKMMSCMMTESSFDGEPSCDDLRSNSRRAYRFDVPHGDCNPPRGTRSAVYARSIQTATFRSYFVRIDKNNRRVAYGNFRFYLLTLTSRAFNGDLAEAPR